MRGSDLRARFERVVMPHRNAAYNLAFWLLGNRHDAEDAVQDAFLRAFRAFAAFKGNAVRPWLLVIVRNVAYTAIQARKRTSNVIVLADDLTHLRPDQSADVVSEAPSPEALAIAEADRRELLMALQRLPVKFREVLV
jgi:RNA polymerase sigma-70 factor, ECF subfamily